MCLPLPLLTTAISAEAPPMFSLSRSCSGASSTTACPTVVSWRSPPQQQPPPPSAALLAAWPPLSLEAPVVRKEPARQRPMRDREKRDEHSNDNFSGRLEQQSFETHRPTYSYTRTLATSSLAISPNGTKDIAAHGIVHISRL